MKAFFSAEEIVEALYEGILGREADAEGLFHHAAELRRRGPLQSVRALLGTTTTGLLVHLAMTGLLVAGAGAVLVLRGRAAVRGTDAEACGPKRPRDHRVLLWSR